MTSSSGSTSSSNSMCVPAWGCSSGRSPKPRATRRDLADDRAAARRGRVRSSLRAACGRPAVRAAILAHGVDDHEEAPAELATRSATARATAVALAWPRDRAAARTRTLRSGRARALRAAARVVREVADRPELGPAKAGRRDPVEHRLPAAGCPVRSAKSTPNDTGPVPSSRSLLRPWHRRLQRPDGGVDGGAVDPDVGGVDEQVGAAVRRARRRSPDRRTPRARTGSPAASRGRRDRRPTASCRTRAPRSCGTRARATGRCSRRRARRRPRRRRSRAAAATPARRLDLHGAGDAALRRVPRTRRRAVAAGARGPKPRRPAGGYRRRSRGRASLARPTPRAAPRRRRRRHRARPPSRSVAARRQADVRVAAGGREADRHLLHVAEPERAVLEVDPGEVERRSPASSASAAPGSESTVPTCIRRLPGGRRPASPPSCRGRRRGTPSLPKPLAPNPPHGIVSTRHVAPASGFTCTRPARRPCGEPQRAVDVARADRHGEPEARVRSRRRARSSWSLERPDDDRGAEQLVAPHPRVRAADRGSRRARTSARSRVAAAEDVGAGRRRLRDPGRDPLGLALVDQRREVRRRVRRVAGAERVDMRQQAVDELVPPRLARRGPAAVETQFWPRSCIR